MSPNSLIDIILDLGVEFGSESALTTSATGSRDIVVICFKMQVGRVMWDFSVLSASTRCHRLSGKLEPCSRTVCRKSDEMQVGLTTLRQLAQAEINHQS